MGSPFLRLFFLIAFRIAILKLKLFFSVMRQLILFIKNLINYFD